MTENIKMLNEEEKLKLIYLARKAEDFELSRNGFGSFSYLTVEKDNILITPSNIKRFDLRPDDIIVLDRTGNIIENKKNNGLPENVDFHLVSYDEREDSIDVIMHINPEHASKRADEGNRIIFLSDCIDPEDSEDGDIAGMIKTNIRHRDYMLIKNHGVLVVGKGIFETLSKAKYIEEIAKIKMPKEEILEYQYVEEYHNSDEESDLQF